jgi:prepilin-type N-terminal cleavage/methylation domain-containing protein
MLMYHLKKAFTLVELMIVIAIIGILAAALFPSMSTYIQRSRDTATSANIKKLHSKLFLTLQDFGWRYPGLTPDIWYCIPLQDSINNCFYPNGDVIPLLPNFEATGLRSKDFNISGTAYTNPLFRYVDSVFTGHAQLTNSQSGKYILYWTIPWDSGYGSSYVIEPSDATLANKRCEPGKVRSINHIPNQTTCQMLIE